MVVQQTRSRPLLFFVVALALGVAAPPMVVAAFLATRWVSAEQSRLEEQTHQITEGALSKVDTYLAGKIAMLQALATSPALDTGDFERIDRQARELLDLQGVNVVMRDLRGQQVVNTRRPWGTPLPKVMNYEADRIVASTHLPFISDLYAGVMAGGPLVRVIVPVLRDGRVAYTLTASLNPESLSKLLAEGGVHKPHFGSIADREGRILGRGEHDPSMVGKPLPGFDAIQGDRGTWRGVNPAGVEVFGTYRRSPLSGWVFTVGTDTAALNQPLFRSLFLLVALASVVGLLGLSASWLIVRKIVRSHQMVSSAAEALGNGQVVEAPHTPVREANLIADALSTASRKLHDQAAALTGLNRELESRVSERTQELRAQATLLETTLDNMAQGLMVVDPDGTVPICNQRALELLDLPANLMAARPKFQAVLQHQIDSGEFDNADTRMRDWVARGGVEKTAHSYVRERPNGTILEIKTVPLGDGSIIRTYTDITAHKEAERAAHRLARRDPLTGLGNRTLFLESLVDKLTYQASDGVAVLCLDLDRFKSVNDTFGHFAGDDVLREVANRIATGCAPDDIPVRLAGDEFAVVQAAADHSTAEALAERLITCLSEPYLLEGTTRVTLGASIGIAVAPTDGVDVDELLKSADLALYRAKDEGRTTFRFFEPSMDIAAREKRSLELDLGQALSRDEFEVHYQPVLCLKALKPCSFEALLRWKHPTRGYVPPSEFIPLAEAAKLIPAIGDWVLRAACREAARWPEHVSIAVNISPVQFQVSNLVEVVVSALHAAKLSPARLELEITEAVLMHQSDEVFATLRTLRQLGVRIALDDFGTGYSSLSYLHRFPLDRIKVDRSFVKGFGDPTSAAIVRTIIGLGSRIGGAITAEGVETPEQLRFVREEGCDAAQGFLFSKAVPAAEARLLMGESSSRAA
ncbi:EAL domain-containing protein [Micromonospora sp. STR1s_5]|nr:EAL domain-containing protein [Micromonospora sp. STR1s_5]